MNKIVVVKKIVSTVVGLGTSKIVKDIIEKNVDTETATSKVTVTAASAAIGFAASDAASDYTDRKIDEMIAWYNKHIKKNDAPES